MPPPVVVAAPRRHASAGSTPKALTPIAMADSPGATSSSSTIKRKREVKDGRETKRVSCPLITSLLDPVADLSTPSQRSAAVADRPRSNSASSTAVTPTSTAASPALSVGSPFVSTAQSPLDISLEMPKVNITDAGSIAPPEDVHRPSHILCALTDPISGRCTSYSDSAVTQNHNFRLTVLSSISVSQFSPSPLWLRCIDNS